MIIILMKYKLLIKTHNKTGLKYLCKTVKEDHSGYKGSGKYWVLHMKKHGRDVTSQLLFETDNIDEFSKYALNKSIELDVVNSNDWANLKHENGLDGGDVYSSMDEDKLKNAKLKMSIAGKFNAENRTEEFNKKVSSGRLNMTDDGKQKRKEKIQDVYATGKHDELFKRYSVERKGFKNPNAKQISIEGKLFGSLKDACDHYGITRANLNRRLISTRSEWKNWKRL